ncbi:hypothetical protein [Paenibacillus sp. KR2-11]
MGLIDKLCDSAFYPHFYTLLALVSMMGLGMFPVLKEKTRFRFLVATIIMGYIPFLLFILGDLPRVGAFAAANLRMMAVSGGAVFLLDWVSRMHDSTKP